jgi:DNA-binding NarL/FixJ family response regulator
VTIRVVLADDQTLVRAGFRVLLEHSDDIEVVAEAADGSDALFQVRKHVPDVVLMDLRMPVMDGLEATRRIVEDQRLSDVKVVALTTFDLDEYVFESLRVGASGFLLKDIEPDELRRAVRVIAAGEALLSPSITRRLISVYAERLAAPPLDASPLDVLTDREREVLTLVGAGLTNDDIAERLYMSPATAKTHVGRTMTKLRVHDRAQLVVLAYETGLVSPGRA